MSFGIGFLFLGVLSVGQGSMAAADRHFHVTHLAPDLLMISTDQGSYSNNSLVFTGPDGVLLVDTHGLDDGTALREFIDGMGLGAPRYIINTHAHEEHVGGNALWGPDPVVVAHHLLPDELRGEAYLFAEYPPEAFPDVLVEDELELEFNGETIRLVDIGGSHDTDEIMVHFTEHGIAHVSSVVNGFQFPSVDSDGDALAFEGVTRRLMTLLPRDVKIVSGHNGVASGFDFVGTWDQLPAYAEMMKETVSVVRRAVADEKSLEEMQEGGLLDEYERYAGSYVGTDAWIRYLVKALTEPREERKDVCRPVFESWKRDGARAAVDCYRRLLETEPDSYDFRHTTLLRVGSVLLERGLHEDACAFLLGGIDLYSRSEYRYYAHYLAARGFQELGRPGQAETHCREALRLRPGFASAVELLERITGEPAASTDASVADELATIEQVVRDSIGWALTKDRPLLESLIAHDDDYFCFHPEGLVPVHGYEEFQRGFDLWMDDRFKATHFDVRGFRAHLSRSGDVAWYSAILDDCYEWDGHPGRWGNTRWTGVLEKRSGKWVIVQMHFSFAAGAGADGEGSDDSGR